MREILTEVRDVGRLKGAAAPFALVWGWLGGFWGFSKAKPLGGISALIILVMAVAAIFAPLITPNDPFTIFIGSSFASPGHVPEGGRTMILGSDAVGRDFFARVVYGARISMIVGITSVFIGLAAGVAIGLASAFYGGRIDLFLQRVVDGLMAFPALVLALVIVTVMGSGIVFAGAQLNVILAIAIILVPLAARVVRGTALSVKENTYVEAAKALGASDLEIMARHILPNITHAVIILGATFIGAAIIVEATLSFLGIGTDITQPSWGNMIAGARARFEAEPRLLWTPAIAMSLTILGFNLLGDALRDVWDPRLRGT